MPSVRLDDADPKLARRPAPLGGSFDPDRASTYAELFAGLVRAAPRVVAQKAKKTKAVRRRAAKPIGKKR